MNKQKYKLHTIENHISESQALYRCNGSENVAQLVEEFQQEGQTFIVTKFQQGGNLLSYLESLGVNLLPEDKARHIFAQIAKGIREVHDNNIVHRDLKHLNVFINDSGPLPRVRIGDFGLACLIENDEQIVSQAGTPAYMAPEVAAGDHYSFAADIWSLGVILYALLSSKLPYKGSDNQQVLQLILSKELTLEDSNSMLWSKVSSSCKDLLLSMLDKD